MKICVIIPAKFNSKRIPGKPLVKLGEQEILLRTYKRVRLFLKEEDIYIFTDSNKIQKKLNLKNIFVITGKFQNGTERASVGLKKIKKKYEATLIISCDNCFINKDTIVSTIRSYKKIRNKKNYCASTVHQACKSRKIFHDRSIAKIVLSNNNDVMYISRSAIPNSFSKKINFFTHHGPVCIKNKFLIKYYQMKNTNLQLAEDNEWLKFLQNGYKIKSILVKKISQEINTKSDLKNYLKKI